MNNYSLDIEKLYDAYQRRGETLRGIACIQYPVYCIHAGIIDTSPDPFGNIERVISEFYFEKPDFTVAQIASLIGTPKSFVEQRLENLTTDGLLKRTGGGYILTAAGARVFKEAVQEREYNRSYDFYVDGINFQPLQRIFYTSYRSKLISEEDLYFYTNYRGQLVPIKPFGSDIVHTPLDKEKVISSILAIDHSDRNDYSIPVGLKGITDISFTRQTFPLLVPISTNGENVQKDIVDGFTFTIDADHDTYYEAVKRTIVSFEHNLKERLQNLEFRIEMRKQMWDDKEQSQVTTNWNEIDRGNHAHKRCYGFSIQDLLTVLEEHFQIKGVKANQVINDDTELTVKINRSMLRATADKQRLIRNLIRGRDYRFFKNNKYVFLFYVMFETDDEFINRIIRLKAALKSLTSSTISKIRSVINNDDTFSSCYRELLCEAGELELLEKLDIEQFMHKLK